MADQTNEIEASSRSHIPPHQMHLAARHLSYTSDATTRYLHFLKDFDALLAQRWAFIMHQILYGEGRFKRLYYQQLLEMKMMEDKTEAWRRRIAETDERRLRR